jgi:hypothetical protein
VSCPAQKVTSEVSVSRRRRSPSARSALPLKASLAQLKRTLGRSAMSQSRRQRCERGQRRSWLEKKLRRPEPGRVVHWRNQPWSRAAEAMSRAGVLGGQLAEATGWPVQPLLGPGSWRRSWRRWLRRSVDIFLRGGDPPTVLLSEAGSDSAEGGVDAEGAAAPPTDV